MRRLILAALLVMTLAPSAQAQNFFTIQPSTVSGITAVTTTRNVVLLGEKGYIALDILINITAGGTATGTLQLFIQDSVDGGTTWDDVVASNTFAFGAAAVTQRFFVSTDLIPSSVTTATATNITQGSAVSVEALGAGSARQGPIGDRLRVREKVSGPSGSPVGPTYTITAVLR